jgi:hypothetical protein
MARIVVLASKRRARAAEELRLAPARVILAAVLVALTLPPCRWLPAPGGMRVRESYPNG